MSGWRKATCSEPFENVGRFRHGGVIFADSGRGMPRVSRRYRHQDHSLRTARGEGVLWHGLARSEDKSRGEVGRSQGIQQY